ncbi:MAG: ABC transporter ATP-binding protein [Planctomycetes bacterium]|nr:ABC transporter ATP-binding protein [Planctomycetota bacterium]
MVRLEAIGKDYGAGAAALTVLRSVDLTIGRGEFVGIVGASGSGKTTMMNILGCLDRPTRGRYVLAGEDVSTLDDDRLSDVRNRSIGFVFQSFQLIPELTVRENVELPLGYVRGARITRSKRHARAVELLTSVGLGHRLTHRPAQLSGGECQRVAVARALANEPALILADEPTGNLDTKSGEDVMQLLFGLHAAGRTIVMVTHNPEIAARLPRVVEMRDGEVLRDGAPHGARESASVGANDEGRAGARSDAHEVRRASGTTGEAR